MYLTAKVRNVVDIVNKDTQSVCGTLNHPIQEKKEDVSTTKPESNGTTTTSNMGKKGTVLLQTARTTATNFDGSR